MPTYEYECEACGHAFEKFQSMTDKPVKTCPSCKKRKVRKLIGAGAGIIFKGSGFYETDYKKKSAPAGESKSESKSESKTESSSSGKSESSTKSESSSASKKNDA